MTLNGILLTAAGVIGIISFIVISLPQVKRFGESHSLITAISPCRCHDFITIGTMYLCFLAGASADPRR